jgi:hypothetical protein
MAQPKNRAAVELGRKGGKKGGLARAAKLTPAQRSESARHAVLARWGRTDKRRSPKLSAKARVPADTSDKALVALLKRLRSTVDPVEIRKLSHQIERIVFHKQFTSA